MNEQPSPNDPLRSLLDACWSPSPVDPDAFSAALEARLRAEESTRRKRQLAWSLSAVAVAALVFLVVIPRATRPADESAQSWLPYTTANASRPLPLPEDYAAIQAVFLSEGSQ